MAADEVTHTIMDNLIAQNNKERPSSKQANKVDHRSIGSHSLSPRSIKGGKGRNNTQSNYLSHMRHSHEQPRPGSSNYYSGGINASFEQIR